MLGDQTNKSNESNLGIDIHRGIEIKGGGDPKEFHKIAKPTNEFQSNQGACQRERHGEHDDERVQEAFKLGGHHKINKDQCQSEDQVDGVARFNVLLCFTSKFCADTVW